jgi:site-specific DNA-methyltransferase (adenine-specific)
MADWYEDEWSAARYYYTAKASKRDRDEGLDGFEAKTKVFNWQSDKSSEDMKDVEKRFTTVGRNVHPTVKPTSLMQYLVRLVTPNGWTVLDPFNWSGSTWKAVMYENKDRNKNYKYIWIELTEEYLPIAKARIEYVINKGIEKEKEEEKAEWFQEQPLFS